MVFRQPPVCSISSISIVDLRARFNAELLGKGEKFCEQLRRLRRVRGEEFHAHRDLHGPLPEQREQRAVVEAAAKELLVPVREPGDVEVADERQVRSMRESTSSPMWS